MTKNKVPFFWTHLVLIILIWASPFFINWKIILFFILLYYLQLIIIGDCIITKKQFKTKKREITFYSFLLENIGFKFNRKKIRYLVDYILPWIILSIALIWQLILKQH